MPVATRKKAAKKVVKKDALSRVIAKKKAAKKITSIDEVSLLRSLDTEATGLYWRRGDRPFMVTACDPEGEKAIWEWRVDPITRRPSVHPQEREEIAEYYSGKIIVFHNMKFDVRMLASIGFEIYFEHDDWLIPAGDNFKGTVVRINALSYHDTQAMSHACNSLDDYHRLKSLGVRYLRFSDDDEYALKEAVTVAKRYCRSHKIEVNFGKSRSYDKQKEEFRSETAADYWLPRFVYSHILNEEGKVPKDLQYLKTACSDYGGKDAERTILLAMFYFNIMQELQVRDGYEKERRLIKTVYKMETEGITYKKSLATKKRKSLEKDFEFYGDSALAFMEEKLGRPSKLGSYPDMQELLYDKLGLPEQTQKKKDKKSGERKESVTTNAAAIASLINVTAAKNSGYYDKKTCKFLQELIISRKYKKGIEALDTYNNHTIVRSSLPDYCWLYPSFNQQGTQTTRFSSSNPNGQNISKVAIIEIGKAGEVVHIELPGPRMRDMFCPLPGKIWYACDYSQLELRIFAFVSQEKALIEALAAGYDFHEFVAMKLFGVAADQLTKAQRRIAKNTNFAIIFGGSPFRVDQTAGMTGAYEMFAGQFPNVAEYMREMIGIARSDGYVRTVDGYRLEIPSQFPYQIVSYKVQGTAGRIIKNAMQKIDDDGLVDWKHSRMALQIHDEILFEFDKKHKSHSPASMYAILQAMEQAGAEMGIYTPASCERIVADWGHEEKVEVTRTSIKTVKKAV